MEQKNIHFNVVFFIDNAAHMTQNDLSEYTHTVEDVDEVSEETCHPQFWSVNSELIWGEKKRRTT